MKDILFGRSFILGQLFNSIYNYREQFLHVCMYFYYQQSMVNRGLDNLSLY